MSQQHSSDPDPKRLPGLDQGGGVPPGDTPPAEGSTSDAGPRETHNPTRGWSKGPLIAMSLIVLLFAVFILAGAVALVL
ncbi:DUF6480 family protein [Streptomyces sp. TP-A0874]|uniref:DUF6480 family protein n=1 Tax=Streptomyces sp. TP-A0874 TaxID=549819 RepID=UPI000853BEB9|nr:DUF6480 family protein [Streptomyces sp. TP-A0874]